MTQTVTDALKLWGMVDASFSLAAARENEVYKVETADATYALRLHRPNYRTETELWSELRWMDAARCGGLSVPQPVPALSGDLLHRVNGVQVDLLTWLSGEKLEDILDTMPETSWATVFHRIGIEMARLHNLSDQWTPPIGFARCAWDRAGLVGDTPLWDQFWQNPALTSAERALFLAFRHESLDELARLEGFLDYGLIHADMVAANVLIDDRRVQIIDFDDGGYGFRLFDIATVLMKYTDQPSFPNLRDALIAGYRTQRVIDDTALELFIALRAATYVGWNITRMDEDGAKARNARFIATAKRHILSYNASSLRSNTQC